MSAFFQSGGVSHSLRDFTRTGSPFSFSASTVVLITTLNLSYPAFTSSALVAFSILSFTETSKYLKQTSSENRYFSAASFYSDSSSF
jgi:hypothetical protein